ncbi:MAG: cyclic pyranopterin monophosphate synthase MoaC [Gemmatimonadaceae bacterium]|nr:cyclic pyranopterin monophosphate synthase MoaC [Gemmatimonadaceae bacterium]NUQ92693.1 cyclic pyranopterin monophosphate synthase MoaC [Gemmatimonadaceae bacterium]NUR19474.1 cyclic pyranopterin monophosphate synthase MoaC [Gemmatimonadaceae bacterium]NUS97725.1 cyclic pyranopterin monophosphate synthase MoaC [Gemmatimonadaceae bacterium]
MSAGREKEGLSHVGADGAARMVDVSSKPETARMARATGTIRMERATLDAILANGLAKGDVIAVARVAGVLAAKKTAELIPLCHPLPLTDVQIELVPEDDLPGLRATATTRTFGRTGVEIEAISAVCVTLVTVYDMAKAIDKTMLISDVCLLEKRGGRSGDWRR